MNDQNDLVLLSTRHVEIKETDGQTIRSILVIPRFLHNHFTNQASVSADDSMTGACENFRHSVSNDLSKKGWQSCLDMITASSVRPISNSEDFFLHIDDLSELLSVGERQIRNYLSDLEKRNILYCYSSKNASINGQPLRKRKIYEFIVDQRPLIGSPDDAERTQHTNNASVTKLSGTDVARHSYHYQNSVLDQLMLPTKRITKTEIDGKDQYLNYGDQLHQFVPYSGTNFQLSETNFSKGQVNDSEVQGRQVATQYGIVEAIDLQVYYAIEQYLTDYLHKNSEHFSKLPFTNTFSVPVATILMYLQRARNSEINIQQVHQAIVRLSTAVFEIKPTSTNSAVNVKLAQYRYIDRAVLLAEKATAEQIADYTIDGKVHPQLNDALNHIYILTLSTQTVNNLFLRESAFVMPKLSLRNDPLLFKIYIFLRNTIKKKQRKSTYQWGIFLRKIFLSEATPELLMEKLIALKTTIDKRNDEHLSMNIVSNSIITLSLWGYEVHFDTGASTVSVIIDTKSFNEALKLGVTSSVPTVPNSLRHIDIAYDPTDPTKPIESV